MIPTDIYVELVPYSRRKLVRFQKFIFYDSCEEQSFSCSFVFRQRFEAIVLSYHITLNWCCSASSFSCSSSGTFSPSPSSSDSSPASSRVSSPSSSDACGETFGDFLYMMLRHLFRLSATNVDIAPSSGSFLY